MPTEKLVPNEIPKPPEANKENVVKVDAERFNLKASTAILTKNAPESVREFGRENALPIMNSFEKNDRAGLARTLAQADPEARKYYQGLFDNDRERIVNDRNKYLDDDLSKEKARRLARGDKKGAVEIDQIREENKKTGRTFYSNSEFNRLVQQNVKELSINEFSPMGSEVVTAAVKSEVAQQAIKKVQEEVESANESNERIVRRRRREEEEKPKN